MKIPSRSPDYVTEYGSAFWWEELIYKGASGTIRSIIINRDTGELSAKNSENTLKLHLRFKVIYDKWLSDRFEKICLGDSDNDFK